MNNEKWLERVDQYEEALNRLEESLAQPKNRFMRDSSIMNFILAYELTWKLLKAFLDGQGIVTRFPRESVREAFRREMIDDDPLWMKMFDIRNDTTHTYNEELAERVYGQLPAILKLYRGLLAAFKKTPGA